MMAKEIEKYRALISFDRYLIFIHWFYLQTGDDCLKARSERTRTRRLHGRFVLDILLIALDVFRNYFIS